MKLSNEEQALQLVHEKLGLAPVASNLLLDDLANYLNELIQEDFNQLVNILYRIDVSEAKVRQELAKGNEDAGKLIARLLIEREAEKIYWRNKFKQT